MAGEQIVNATKEMTPNKNGALETPGGTPGRAVGALVAMGYTPSKECGDDVEPLHSPTELYFTEKELDDTSSRGEHVYIQPDLVLFVDTMLAYYPNYEWMPSKQGGKAHGGGGRTLIRMKSKPVIVGAVDQKERSKSDIASFGMKMSYIDAFLDYKVKMNLSLPDGVKMVVVPYDTSINWYALELFEASLHDFTVFDDLRKDRRFYSHVGMFLDKVINIIRQGIPLDKELEMNVIFIMMVYSTCEAKTKNDVYKKLKQLLDMHMPLIFPTLCTIEDHGVIVTDDLEMVRLLYAKFDYGVGALDRAVEKLVSAHEETRRSLAETRQDLSETRQDVKVLTDRTGTLEANLNDKADKTYVEANLNDKADKTYVDMLFTYLLSITMRFPDFIKDAKNAVVRYLLQVLVGKTTEIQADVATNTAKIEANKENIQTNKTNIQTNKTNIEANQDQIEETSMRIGYMSDKTSQDRKNLRATMEMTAKHGKQLAKHGNTFAAIRSAVASPSSSSINEQE